MRWYLAVAWVCLALAIDTDLVENEVELMVSTNPDMPVDECVAKCDDLFPMNSHEDEAATDAACQDQCNWQINHNGTEHHHDNGHHGHHGVVG